MEVTAEDIACALGGHPTGNGWIACCPAHDDRKPSLSISVGNDGKVLVNCHAGCAQEDVIAALRTMKLWPGGPLYRFDRSKREVKSERVSRSETENSRRAQAIWDEAQSTRGTLAEDYLRARGYGARIPSSLRFHPSLWHAPSKRKRPALVAKVTRWPSQDLVGIQRIYLSHWKKGSKAPVDDEKMSLGLIQGGTVRLGKVKDTLLIGEGVETTLCASEMADVPGWATLGSWNFHYVVLPKKVRWVIIAADHDKVGKNDAYTLKAALTARGLKCSVAMPPEEGQDWADVAKAEGE